MNINNFIKFQYIYGSILVIGIAGLLTRNWEILKLDLTLFAFMTTINYFWGIYLLKANDKHIKEKAIGMSMVQKDIFFKSPWPYVVLDVTGNVIWNNVKFNELVNKKKVTNKNINTLITDLNADDFLKKETSFFRNIKREDTFYKVHIHMLEAEEYGFEKFLYSLTFVDETEEVIAKEKLINKRPVTAVIYIDNYDDIINTMEDAEASLLFAVIDRELNSLALSLNAIVKKYEKDKYLLVLKNESLKELVESKFDILNKIRDIDVGNKLPVTLSFGISSKVKELDKNLEESKEAIELAIGRGGDQAVVKFDDKYKFFGGVKKKEVKKYTRVKSRIKAEKLKELIKASNKVFIMGHVRPDLDCLGAAVGVFRAAKHLKKETKIILNDVNTSIKHLYNKLESSDLYEESIFMNSEQALKKCDKNSLLVVVDVNDPSYTEFPEVIDKFDKKVVIDHHRKTTHTISKPTLEYVETYASSASEIITEMLQYIDKDIDLKQIEAESLLAGITVDTQNFVFRTGVKTFEAAAFLRKYGADGANVSMLFQNDLDSFKNRTDVLKGVEIFNDDVAIAKGDSEAENPSLIAAKSANEMLNISGIEASFVVTELEDRITVSARSYGNINVQRIMEKIGGGGHFTAAGAQLDEYDVADAINRLKRTIVEYKEEVKTI